MPARLLLLRRSGIWPDARAFADMVPLPDPGLSQRPGVLGPATGPGQDRLRQTGQLFRAHRRSEAGPENSRSPRETELDQIPQGAVAANQSIAVGQLDANW